MNKSRLLIAVAVLIGLSVAVGMTTRSRESQTKVEKPSTTLPVVKKEEVTTLEITRPGQPAIVLQKQADKWRVTAPTTAEAGKPEVESALDKLAELEVTAVAASRKENHQRLEVDAAHAVHVQAKAGDKLLADLYIGASKSGGTMVRVEGNDAVLAVRGSIRYVFDKDVKDFRNRDVTDFDASELTAIALSSAKGTFKFEKQGEVWTQAAGAKPIAKFDPEKVERLATALSSLRAVDFAQASDGDAVTGLNAPLGKATLTKKDGSSLEIAVGKQHKDGTEHFARANTGDTVYRITNFSSERIMADANAFEKVEQKPGEPAAGAPGMPGGPHGMPGGQGLPEGLPPELLKQLQEMQAKGQAPH